LSTVIASTILIGRRCRLAGDSLGGHGTLRCGWSRRYARWIYSAIFANTNLVAQLGSVLRGELLEIEVNRLLDRPLALLLAQVDRNRGKLLRLLLIALFVDNELGRSDPHVIRGRKRDLNRILRSHRHPIGRGKHLHHGRLVFICNELALGLPAICQPVLLGKHR
jgi:hypothetical protein